jgi:hypothetical protein
MPFYEFEHIPGIDWLGKGIGNELPQKQVSSVAAQLGRKQILTETFAITGWDINPNRLKYIGDFQYLYGINYMCHHLLSYSLKGQGKKDYPTSFGKQLRWKNGFKIFNDYFTRLGYLNICTDELVNTLVLNPLSSVFTEFKENENKSEGFSNQTDINFQNFLGEIGEKQISYHLADEIILQKFASVKNGKITVGEVAYDYLILPELSNLNKSTYYLIVKFIDNGGKVYIKNKPIMIDGVKADIDLKSNITIEEIENSNIIKAAGDNKFLRSSVRYSEKTGKIIYLFNMNDNAEIDVNLKIEADNISIIDLTTLSETAISQKLSVNITEFNIKLKPMQMVVLSCGSELKYSKENEQKEKEIISDFKLSSSEDNIYTMDFAQISYDGINYSDKMYMFNIMEKLIKEEYNNKIFVRHSFNIDYIPEKMNLMFEKLDYLSIKVNGNEIKYNQSNFDINFIESNIKYYIIIGENEITYEVNYYQDKNVKYALYDPTVAESIKNCLIYNTELESMYLMGDFKVEFEKSKKIDGYIICSGAVNLTKYEKEPFNLFENGYVFFSGKQNYSAEIDLTDCKYIKVEGKFLQAELYINKEYIGIVMFDDKVKINYNGLCLVEIKATYSYRNMLGPHHTELGRDIGAPFYFTFVGTWNENGSNSFKNTYLFEDSELKSIKLLK